LKQFHRWVADLSFHAIKLVVITELLEKARLVKARNATLGLRPVGYIYRVPKAQSALQGIPLAKEIRYLFGESTIC
jgi:hypothetical protein